MTEPKWKTKPFTIVGWIWIGILAQIAVIDLYLACDDKIIEWLPWWPIGKLPTLSQYVQWRYADQGLLLAVIVVGFLTWLAIHFFGKRKK